MFYGLIYINNDVNISRIFMLSQIPLYYTNIGVEEMMLRWSLIDAVASMFYHT